MRTLKSNILVLSLLAGFSGAAVAGNGAYLALDGGQTSVPGFCDGMSTNFRCDSTATALRVAAGFQINSLLAIEVNYGNYGKLNVSGTYLTVPVTGDTTLTGTQIAGIVSLPLSDAFALTGKIGVGSFTAKTEAFGPGVKYSSSADNSTMVYGVGVRLNFSKTLALRAQYESLGNIKSSSNDTASTVNVTSAGIIFGF